MVWLKSGPLVRGVLLRKEKPPNRTKNGLLIRVLVRLEQNKINDLALVLVHCLVRGPSGPDPGFLRVSENRLDQNKINDLAIFLVRFGPLQYICIMHVSSRLRSSV